MNPALKGQLLCALRSISKCEHSPEASSELKGQAVLSRLILDVLSERSDSSRFKVAMQTIRDKGIAAEEYYKK